MSKRLLTKDGITVEHTSNFRVNSLLAQGWKDVTDGAPAAAEVPADLGSLTVKALLDLAGKRGVAVAKSAKKDEIIAALNGDKAPAEAPQESAPAETSTESTQESAPAESDEVDLIDGEEAL